jgi:P27 family predicted phage terminase small subunit
MAGAKGRSGRPPKPPALHALDGTFRPDRHGKQADLKPTGDGTLPPPPANLAPMVRAAWLELAETITFKIFSKDDTQAFRTFAAMWATWKEVAAHVGKHGVSCTTETKDGRVVHSVSPEARIWMDLNGKLLNYFGRFGMTPVDRARIKEVGGAHNAKQEDPDEEFGTQATH